MNLAFERQAATSAPVDVLTRHRFLPSRHGVIELAVLFAAILAIERLFLPPGELNKLQPHPFWVPVILLSLQYGTAEGVLAASAAILSMHLLSWPSQAVGEEYYHYVIRAWAVPIGWIVAAIVIGEIRSRQRSQLVELRRDFETKRSQAEVISRHCQHLEEKIERIERAFATVDPSSLDAIAAALRDLGSGNPDDWRRNFERVHRSLIGCGTISFLCCQDQSIILVERSHMPGEPTPPPLAGPTALSPLVKTVLGLRRPANASRLEDAQLLDGIAAMAAPVLAEHGGPVMAALLLENITPERMNADTENRLALFARELAHALGVRGMHDLIEGGTIAGQLELGSPVHPSEPPAEASPRRFGLLHRFGRA